MNEYKENAAYEEIGKHMIEKEEIFSHIRDNEVRIRYLESNKPATKGKRITLGECRKISEKTKNIMKALPQTPDNLVPDFVIIIYKERIHGFTLEQLRILIMHELMHIGIKEDSETGQVKFHVVKHDLEDFHYIVNRFGADWNADKSQITWEQLWPADADPQNVDPETGEIIEEIPEEVEA